MSFDRSILTDLEANLPALDIDEIKKRLEPLMKGYSIATPIFDPGAVLYRARRITPAFNKQIGIGRSSLIYPPKEVAKLGRLNRPGQSVFYGSVHKESVFFEIQGLQPGDELILTFWKTNEKMFVNNIGYTEYVFGQFGAKRPVPQWNPQSAKPKSDKETIALAELPPEVVQTLLSEDDRREVAVLPWFVDTHLTFRKALYIRIDSRTDTSISITYLDSAKEFDSNGTLIWLGKPSHWSVRPGQKAKFTAVAGVDDDGDYQMSTDGHPYHWTAVDCDTGEPIEAR